jgi:phosphoribosylglycinamide formyltransferase 1
MDARIAVLASGVGSNLQALLDDPVVRPWVALVVSDGKEARALERGRAAGVEAVFLDPAAFDDRAGFDAALLEMFAERDIGFVVNAGFMRILGPEIVRAYEGRWLNVHPSLLPSFPGANAVPEALAWGVKVTGATVHLLDEEVDHGPIVLQQAVPVLDDDDEWSLHGRIQEAEHRIYKSAVRALVEGRVRVEGRRSVMAEGPV